MTRQRKQAKPEQKKRVPLTAKFGAMLQLVDRHPGLAAWASAFAAVVSLGISGYALWDANSSAERRAVQAVAAYTRELQISTMAMSMQCESLTASGWAWWEASMRDAMSVGGVIAIDKLPESKMEIYMTLRSTVLQAYLEVKEISDSKMASPVKCSRIRDSFESLSTRIKVVREIFAPPIH